MASLEHYLKIQTRREFIEKWIYEPFFAKAIIGTFVRLSIGTTEDGKGGVHGVYRMCEVTDVEEVGNAYKLDPKGNAPPITTRITVDIAGKSKNRIKMNLVSNHRITEQEFKVYMRAIAESRSRKPLTEQQCNNRRLERDSAVNHVYTEDEIKSMVGRKQGLSNVMTTDNKTALASLRKKEATARETGDLDTLEIVQKEIEKLEMQIKIEKDKSDKSFVSVRSTINMQAKRANTKKDSNLVEKAYSSTNADPYTRRPTISMNIWTQKKEKGEKPNESTATPNEKSDTPGVAVPAHTDDASWRIGKVNLDIVRENVFKRLGVDPYEKSREDRRQRYLRSKCGHLPPLGSAERERIRHGMSLASYERDARQQAMASQEAGEDMDMDE